MEEEKKDLEEQKAAEEKPGQRKTFIDGLKDWADSVPTRSSTIMGLVGAYLIYTGYSLIAGFVRGDEDSGLIFVLFAVIFILIAIFFLYVCFHAYSRRNKENQQAQEEIQQLKAEIPETAGEVQAEEEAAGMEEPVQKKSSGMTLAERASLANTTEDKEE